MKVKAPMSRLRINDLRRTVAATEMPDRARARYLAVLDQMEVEWADEVMRRAIRRRNAPIRAAERALSELGEAFVNSLRALVERLRERTG